MADTVYTDGATLLTADTMNDLNRLHYTILGDPATGKAALTSLGNQASYAPWTTGGTDTAYTLTPTPASTANATGQRFRVTFNAASGATPTLAVSGQTAKSLKYYDSAGAKQAITSTQVPINWISDVEYDGTDWVVLDVPPAATASVQIQPISASVGASALTISASALSLDFRSATLTSGAVTTVAGTPANLVISSGSTLGTTNAVETDLAVIALNNAGTIELAVVNMAGGVNLSESALISTTAEGGAGAADSASTVYSTTARTNVAYRVLGFLRITEATAGTWATAPSLIQGADESILTKIVLNANGPAPIYPCRAWVNFNGTGTVAIRASGNVSSVGDAGTGTYDVNLATAIGDANYSVCSSKNHEASNVGPNMAVSAFATNSFRLTSFENGSATDCSVATASLFR
jgi:hypothetical protein